MNILTEIIEYKRKVVAARKAAVPIAVLERSDLFRRNCNSLKASLTRTGSTGIIAEFKRRSPSKGIINGRSTVEEVTSGYASNGASGLSVLTDEKYFGGSDEDLIVARKNALPILRKDFIVDEYQLVESKSIGADVVLLIAACLSKDEVKQLAATAKALGLEVLFEVHNGAELDSVCDAVDMVGVNNRNLATFEVDIRHSLDLVNKIGTDKVPVAESGIDSVETIRLLRDAGFKGFLMGEHFMKQDDPTIAFADFANQLKAR